MKVLWRVLKYLRPYWHWEIAAYLAMLGITGVRLFRPELIRRVIDIGIAQGDLGVLRTSVLLILGLTLLQGLFRFGEAFITEWISQNIARTMRSDMYQKITSLSFRYHDRTESGQLLSRVTSDVDRLRGFTGRAILHTVDAVILLIGTSVILFQRQPQLAAVSLLVMPIIFVLMKRYMEEVHPLWHKRQDQMGVMTSRLEQNLHGLKVVRGFAQEDAEIQRFQGEIDKIYDISMQTARKSAFTMPLVVLLASISSTVIIWLGGRLVITGLFTVGELVAFNSYVLQLVGPIRRLSNLVNMLSEARASADRVFDVLDAESEVKEAPDAVALAEVEGRVTFDHVSFAYEPGRPALDDVSFDVAPGSTVALLGPTGAGKTTIVNLIPRFYDVTEGAVLIDGTDIRSVTLESLRKQIAIVLQETMLFATTIRENIAFGRPDATQEEIEAAAKAAQAHDFIMSFPDGYDTEIGERGVTLSGGQRQRIAIARALLLNPRILVLDDATSSVDTETEQQIQRALDNVMRGRTSFIIAQRVSTVRNADVIMVIDKGRLVAQGRHEELVRESPLYADIYQRQLRRDAEELAPALGGALS